MDGSNVPTILLKNTEDYPNKPWRDEGKISSDYFNYGFNEETWNKHSEMIRKKLADHPQHLDNKLDILNYMFNFPSDLGGLGEELEIDRYDNLNFFSEYKTKSRQFPSLEIKDGSIYVPLEMNHQIMPNKPMPQPNNVVNFMGTFNQYMLYPAMMNEMYMKQQRMMLEASLKKK
jgi:hypothetical protein